MADHRRKYYTEAEIKELRGETTSGVLKGAGAGATAGFGIGATAGGGVFSVPASIVGAVIGGVVGAVGGGVMARREAKAAVKTGRAAQSAKKAQTEAIHRSQEFEREAQAAGAKGQKGAPARPIISDDAALVQATDIGGGTAYDRWYRDNFRA